jgi:hypothetical protein
MSLEHVLPKVDELSDHAKSGIIELLETRGIEYQHTTRVMADHERKVYIDYPGHQVLVTIQLYRGTSGGKEDVTSMTDKGGG